MHPTPSADVKPSVTEPELEIQRHSAVTRLLHWSMALCFLVAMSTGLALYWQSILAWTMPLFGGKPSAVQLHFWFGLGLGLTTLVLALVWRAAARWTAGDTHFVRHLSKYASGPHQAPPPDTGFFNGGQKLYFWAAVVSTLVFVVTGLVWWFRKDVPHPIYVVCRTTHRVLGVTMSAALLVHIYKATIGEPGTFRSMIGGTVTREWARLRRPRWFREVTKGE
jgi:formate dehydrogenase subunit gamma